ncbi:unnamed protein product [Calicophoron daubneyi]|uniref:Saposin B-type domain-containing protein n=1 Tax=Calicophoron daubneyi TaxID=300641 RepID=A0AAV2TDU4_CALDB
MTCSCTTNTPGDHYVFRLRGQVIRSAIGNQIAKFIPPIDYEHCKSTNRPDYKRGRIDLATVFELTKNESSVCRSAHSGCRTDDDLCLLCEEFMTRLKEFILHEASHLQLITVIEGYCQQTLDPPKCMEYWRKQLHELKTIGRDIEIEEVCKKAGQC